ncbi:MAG: maltose acetyltransferase domain-containing protein [Christensenellaceae bacterium]
MSKRAKVPVNCFFQGCYNPEYERKISKCKDKCFKYNQLNPNDRENQRKLLAEILGKAGKNAIITPPFWCDYGYNRRRGRFLFQSQSDYYGRGGGDVRE